MTDSGYPEISCVVIGINSSRTLKSCLEAIKNADYPNIAEIIYVDGGSTDDSISIARGIAGVEVMAPGFMHSSPAKQRNAGWRRAKSELVQFLDSDTQVHPLWFKQAVDKINSKVAAVYGYRKELYPDKNWYHFIADLEWNLDEHNFGGDVLIKRTVLEEMGGYNDNLRAGEDPELAVRIRVKGYKIKRLPVIMCLHDINMAKFSQYIRRSFLSGYAYAQACLPMAEGGYYDWLERTLKIIFKVGGTTLLLAAAVIYKNINLLFAAIILNAIPMLKIPLFKMRYKLTLKKSIIYALHLILWAYPAAIGIIRYYFGRLFHRPLSNGFYRK